MPLTCISFLCRLSEHPQGQRSSVGGEKASRALVFFANPEEAYRASNTLHNKVLREKPARLHVIT